MKILIVLSTSRTLAAVYLFLAVNTYYHAMGRYTNQDPFEEKKPFHVAETSKEWTDRLKLNIDSWSLELDDLFTKLPPEKEWPEIITTLKNIDPPKDDTQNTIAACGIFAHLLEGPESHPKALKAYQGIISRGDKLREYEERSTRSHLIKLGLSPEETTKFLANKIEVVDKKKEEEDKKKEDASKPWKKLLAEGDLENGIKLLRKEAIKETKADPTKTKAWEQLLKIAILTKKPDLLAEAETKIEKAFFPKNKKDHRLYSYSISSLLDYWVEQEKWEKIITATSSTLAISKQNENLSDASDFLSYKLLAIAKTGTDKELSAELAGLPSYEIDTEKSYLKLLSFKTELIPEVLKIHRKNGESEKSISLLHHLLALNSGTDLLYKELIAHHPEQAPEIFAQLKKLNPFEERPLIWQAHIALQKNEIAEARTLIEEAIKLDPSDGDQGKHTRMEAYRVLSEVYAAEGDDKKSLFLEEVVTAIREGEKADDLLYAGLNSEAIRRYKEALGHYEDAYCLQSRLAKSLLEIGDIPLAKIHLEKAFRLMPSSFGPVESHCFGCEGVFESPEAKEIAERVFTEMVAEDPENPRTYYLVGLLYTERKLGERAFEYFLKAFEKDPRYYNCAKRLKTYFDNNPESIAKHRGIYKRTLAIIPYIHITERFRGRVDLKQVWIEADQFSKTLENPLKLAPLPLPFEKPEEPKNKDQYYGNEYHALDGWTRQEMLDNNSLLSDLNYF